MERAIVANKADSIHRMKELTEILREASKAYYAEDREIMSNREYDALYEELQVLEKETGMVLTGSPTITVGYEAVDELPKEAHESPMLSLDKNKGTRRTKKLAEWKGWTVKLEAGWADNCFNLSKWKTGKSCYARKW